MDEIFQRESQLFLKTLKNYIKGESTYEDLLIANTRLDAAHFGDLTFMRTYIHKVKLNEYKCAMEFEKKIKELEKTSDNPHDIRLGLYQGCTTTAENPRRLPPYPMVNMINFGTWEKESEYEKKDDFSFDF